MECWKRQLFPIKQSEIYIEGPVQQATSVLTYTKLGPSLQRYQSKLKDWLLTIFELISWKWISQTFSTELSFSNVTKPKPASKQANKRIKNHCQPQHVKHTIDSPLQLCPTLPRAEDGRLAVAAWSAHINPTWQQTMAPIDTATVSYCDLWTLVTLHCGKYSFRTQ